MKKSIIAAVITGLLLFGANYMSANGYQFKGMASAETSSREVGDVTYDQAIISLGYEKIVVMINDIDLVTFNGHNYYVITDDTGNVYRADCSNVVLSQKYIRIDTQEVDITN